MSVDEKTVRKVAKLARLAVPEERLAPMAGELNKILAWVEQLGELDVNNVEPMTSVAKMRLMRRADVVNDGNIADDLMRNAPNAIDNYFTVPKVVE
ncbi:MAG TPA: Asp-tRNA(Asn)/Glu-tRNA(Gln) amidotransferase subunit GatC [Micropepsaceae bacterium]|nr:Asp-tRNA(Asn)/Glu-tRNA(Gln) amidotransferase subunit GatC [Micropepsaceae bacterium]